MLDKLFPEKKDMDAFREKVQDITRHPVTKAMYTTTPQGFTWQQVENEKLLVLIDLRDIRRDALRFAMVWVFWNLVDYIELHRPSHNTPLSIIIDELSVLMKTGSFLADKQAADDMNELLNKTMRHKNIFLTVAHQQAVQFPGLIGKLLSDNRNCR